ncbi:MAG: acyltransferase [Ramlibacter sp.]
MQPKSTQPNYPGIDLLRALAAMLVLVYHVIEVGGWSGFPTTGAYIPWRQGWIGVDLFFTISGFVIALSALDGLQREGLQFRKSFAVRRLARIVPLYLLTCAAFLALIKPSYLQLSPYVLITHIGSHLLFLHNLNPHTHGSINGPSWSIALEMQFYLLMIWVTPRLVRASPVRLAIGAMVVAASWRFLMTILLVPGEAEPILQLVYTTQLPGVIDQFALGIALAMTIRQHSGFALRYLLPGWRNFSGWFLLAGCLLGLANSIFHTSSYWQSTAMIVGWRPLLGAGFAALLAAAICFPWANARALAPIRYVGTISYGIYLWHMLVLLALTANAPGVKGSGLLIYTLVSTLALAFLTWNLLEKPNLQRYGRSPSPVLRESPP